MKTLSPEHTQAAINLGGDDAEANSTSPQRQRGILNVWRDVMGNENSDDYEPGSRSALLESYKYGWSTWA